jgi:hypothetical protein
MKGGSGERNKRKGRNWRKTKGRKKWRIRMKLRKGGESQASPIAKSARLL